MYNSRPSAKNKFKNARHMGEIRGSIITVKTCFDAVVPARRKNTFNGQNTCVSTEGGFGRLNCQTKSQIKKTLSKNLESISVGRAGRQYHRLRGSGTNRTKKRKIFRAVKRRKYWSAQRIALHVRAF